MRTRAVFAVIILASGGLQNPKVERFMAAAEKGTMCAKRDSFIEVHKAGKAVIPALIESISRKSKVSTHELENPLSSSIVPGALEPHFAGIWAMFAIDAIMSRSPSADRWRPPDWTSAQPASRECVFLFEADPERIRYRGSAQIVKSDGSEVTAQDMLQISQLYRNWWLKHGDKILVELQTVWMSGDRPLKGSVYSW